LAALEKDYEEVGMETADNNEWKNVCKNSKAKFFLDSILLLYLLNLIFFYVIF
jgi:hypothetical protein